MFALPNKQETKKTLNGIFCYTKYQMSAYEYLFYTFE